MTPIDVSIVIPAYMEAKRISATLQALAAFLETRHYGAVEVIVVVADSPDGTAELAEAEAHRFGAFRVIRAGRKIGKGRDVRIGMMEAKGRVRLFMDADLATPLEHLDDVMAATARGAQVGIAVRNLIEMHEGVVRKLISSVGNILAQVVLLPGVGDTQCGFKFFTAEATEAVFSRMTILGWGFDLEILAVARNRGYVIEQIPAPDWHDPKAADEGLIGDSAAGAALKTFRDLLQIRFNLLRGRYRQPVYVHTPQA